MALDRRRFVLTGASGLVGASLGLGRPYLSRAADRPALSHGLQSGDVGSDTAMVWARADRPCRAMIEWSTTESFAQVRGGVFADALPETDGTVKVALEGLPAGQDIFYRVSLEDLAAPTIRSPGRSGASARRRPTGARCRSAGRGTRRARAGGSTNPVAA